MLACTDSLLAAVELSACRHQTVHRVYLISEIQSTWLCKCGFKSFTILPVFYGEGDCTTLRAQGLKGIQNTFKSMYSKQNRPILHLTFISCGRKAFSYNPWLKAADMWYWLRLRQMPCTWIFLFVSLPSKHRSTHSFTRQSLPCGFVFHRLPWIVLCEIKNFILGMNTVKLQYTH